MLTITYPTHMTVQREPGDRRMRTESDFWYTVRNVLPDSITAAVSLSITGIIRLYCTWIIPILGEAISTIPLRLLLEECMVYVSLDMVPSTLRIMHCDPIS
jgi:hypothetical protein